MADIQGTINGETIDGTSEADTINAGGGDDTVNGLGGDDTLNGQEGNDTVNGGDGHDILRGANGDDVLNGDAGDDILIGGAGNDVLNGGSGADRVSLYTEANGITVDLRLDGVAQNFGALGTDTLYGIEHVFATYWGDTIYGTESANWVFAAAGNDYVATFGGNDYVTLGYGDKIVEAGDGNDTVEVIDDALAPLYTADGITVSLALQGQAQATGIGNWTLTGVENLSGDWGSDEFTGDGGDNILAGGGGDDTLNGAGGNDTLMGDGAIVIGAPFTFGTWGFVADLNTIGFSLTEGKDVLHGGDGNDTLYGGGNDDELWGEGDNDTLYGGAGHDALRGGVGDDALYGEAGDDYINGGAGNDILNGGAGNDRITLFDGTGSFGVTVDLRIDGVAQNFGPFGTDTLFSIEHVTATYGSDTLYGNGANNWFWTFGGSDVLAGEGGDDYFTVGDQDKVIDGGTGNDTVEIDDTDAFTPAYTAGGITVSLVTQGAAQWTGISNWTLTSIENLSGSWGADRFTGDGNANILAGAGGDDTLDGGAGDDILMGDGAMVINHDPANPGSYGFFQDAYTFTAVGIVAGNDILSGGAGNDTLYGGGGNDQLRGNADNDALYGGSGDDFLVGGAGDDILDGGAGADRISLFDGSGTFGVTVDLRSDGIVQNFGPLGNDTLYGIEHVTATYGNDNLTGNEAGNWFWAFSGTDYLTGNGGDDYFTVGKGDKFLSGGIGSDTIEVDDQDFTPAYGANGITVSLALQGQVQAVGTGNWTLTEIENLSGNFGADHFIGDDNANTLAGAGGNDVLEGGGGNDILMGDGAILFGDDAANPGAYHFVAQPRASYGIVAGNDTLLGGAGNDTLYGGGGDDVLDGGTGADNMQGGAGNDVYYFDYSYDGVQGDGLYEQVGEGIDEVRTTVGLGIQGWAGEVENLTALGTGDIFLGGNDLANVLTGNSGNNYFVGEGGNDTISGGAGNDVASYQLPAGTVGMPTIAYGTGLDAGTIFVNLVDGANVQGFLKISGGAGNFTVQGVGVGAFLGTDTLSGIEEIHAFVRTADNSPATQFVAVNLAAHQYGDFVGGGEFSETLNLADFAGAVNANGNGGDDIVNGTAVANNLQGGLGNDTLNGAEGNDSLDGGAGNDIINGGADDDYITGGAGNDVIDGGTGTNDVASFHLPSGTTGTLRTVAGTGADRGFLIVERVDGPTVEQIFRVSVSNAGVATVQGLNSAAWMGTDTVANWDQLHFTVDNQTFDPNQFTNIIARTGTAANDTITGIGVSDVIYGGAGEDILRGAGGADIVYGGADWDRIQGGAGDDTLFGEDGADLISGNAGNDWINGGAGLDTVNMGDAGLQGITIDLNLDGVAQNFGALGTDTLVSIESVYTAGGDDVITGTDGANVVFSSGGNDTIDVRGGDDYVFTLAGNKNLNGGTGVDTLEYSGGDESYYPTGIELSLALQGQDQVTSVGTWNIRNFENLSGADANDRLTGDGNANILAGASGDDVLSGGDGNDTLGGDGIFVVGADPANRGTFAFYADAATGGFNIPQGNDTLYGGAGNDTLYGGGGNDVLDGGTGIDKLYGDAGNDTLVIADPVNNTEVYDGGADNDTLEVRAVAGGLPLTNYNLTGVTLTSIENIKFASTISTGAGAILSLAQVTSSGLTTLTGGDGVDRLTLVATGALGGTFTVPTLTLTDWHSSNNPLVAGDVVILTGAGNGAFTLNAREGLSSVQALIGGTGNDTLNGSSGTDLLNGGGGNNVLNGNDGDDVLLITNIITAQGTPTFTTGFGSTFNGGAGRDALSIGGYVNFQGTLVGVEGFFLQPAVSTGQPLNNGGQEAAVLAIDLSYLNAMPSDFFVHGTGTIMPIIAPGASFNLANVVFEAGSNVTFRFEGVEQTNYGSVTWVGTSHGDQFEFGSEAVTVTGGGGSDSYELEFDADQNVTILDFTPGVDKLDLTDSELTTLQRLSDFATQQGNDVVIHAEVDGNSATYVLKNVQLSALTQGDLIVQSVTDAQIDTGTTGDDYLFGFTNNDVLHGDAGNDRLYSGGGLDKLYGDSGDDTLIVDGPIAVPGSVFDGGAGNDTLELRTGSPTNFNAYFSTAGYAFSQTTVTGLETVHFASTAAMGVGASMLITQVNGGVSQLIGGAGVDTFVTVVVSAFGTNFVMPSFTLTDWHSSTTPYANAGDSIALVASGAGNFTLTARDGLATTQSLLGSVGNDTLNGSSGTDILNGFGGTNVLLGNGGDDVLVIANVVDGQGVLPTFNGAGSTFDGGDGFDTLSVGGVVDFQGSLTNVERIFLQPAFNSPAPLGAGTVAAANLTLHAETVSLPNNLVLAGNGAITVDLDPGDTYDASGWTLAAGSNVALTVLGSSDNDVFRLGGIAETVIDDGGLDTVVLTGTSAAAAAVTVGAAGNLTIGNDTLKGVELFQFSDGIFFWNGTTFVSAVSEGLVADGYIANAQVYIDANNNGVLDANEPFALTDPNGDFTLISPYSGPLRAVGGTNTDTGLPNTVTLSAPEGAGVINPLTTLVQSLVQSGSSPDAAAAELAVKTAFGIDASVDLTNLDLIAAATDQSNPAAAQAALDAQKAAASVAQVLTVVNNVGGDTSAALTQLSATVASAATSGTSVDLTDSSTLTTIVSSGVTSGTPANTSDIVAVVQSNTQAITSATTLAAVTAAQQNAAPTPVVDAYSVFENASLTSGSRAEGVLGNDVDPDVAETGLLRVVSAQGTGLMPTAVTTAAAASVAGAYGTLSISADGRYSYAASGTAADALAAGVTANDVFTYAIVDPSGQKVSSTVTFTVTGIDDAAVANADLASVAENAIVTGNLAANDVDVDTATITIAEVNGSAANVGSQIALASGALLTVNANGSYSYDPNGKFDYLTGSGSGASNTSGTDSFTYTLANGGTATVTLTVNGISGPGDQLRGSIGSDTVNGTVAADFFMLQAGGEDVALGNNGDDLFYFGAAFSAGDVINGGAGVDQVGLQGDYSGGLTLSAGNLVDVDALVLMSGSDTRFGDPGTNFYSYSVTTVDANVGAGQQLIVSANNLQVGENLVFNGSAETDGSFFTFGGFGTDVITGGDQVDLFYFGRNGHFGASDLIDGRAGIDQLGLQGDYTVHFGAGQLHSVEAIVLLSASDARFAAPGQGFTYDLTMDDGNVAAGETMYISGTRLHSGEVLTFNGAAETSGGFIVFSGAANDIIVTGGGNDQIFGAGGADTMTGGGGNDTFAYLSEMHSTAAARDTILDFTSGDVIDLSRIDALAGTAANDAFTAIGSAAFSGAAGELRYEHLSGNQWLVQADTDGIAGADFELLLQVTDGHTLAIGDFVL